MDIALSPDCQKQLEYEKEYYYDFEKKSFIELYKDHEKSEKTNNNPEHYHDSAKELLIEIYKTYKKCENCDVKFCCHKIFNVVKFCHHEIVENGEKCDKIADGEKCKICYCRYNKSYQEYYTHDCKNNKIIIVPIKKTSIIRGAIK